MLSAKKLLPTNDDTAKAALGLLRLQTTYRVDTLDMAEGKIVSSGLNIYSSSPLTGILCFKIDVYVKIYFVSVFPIFNQHKIVGCWVNNLT